MKKEIQFIDADNHTARITVEITERNGYPEFTVSGRVMGHGGQCSDSIKPANADQKELLRLWDVYHLKDVSGLQNFAEQITGVLARIESAEKERGERAPELEGDEALLEKMENEGIDADRLDAVKAYISLGIESDDGISDFEESYAGQHDSDEDFAREQADSIGVEISQQWPSNCIDWEQAARELMYDYSEAEGYYFRNI